MTNLIGSLIGLVILFIWLGANFYLFCQWVVYPKLRRRFQICKPYLLLGWVLYILGGSVFKPLGRVQNSDLLTWSGTLIGLIGLGLTVYAAARLLRANAAERKVTNLPGNTFADEGTWPPAPVMQADSAVKPDSAVKTDVELLLKCLQETIAFLRHYKRDSWADWMQKSSEIITSEPLVGIKHLRGAFGGMGSFNDVVIHPTNGDALTAEEAKPVNDHLGWLQGELYRLSGKIKQEIERGM